MEKQICANCNNELKKIKKEMDDIINIIQNDEISIVSINDYIVEWSDYLKKMIIHNSKHNKNEKRK